MLAGLRRSYLEMGPTGPSVSFLPSAWLPVSQGVCTGHCYDSCTHPELNTSKSDLSIQFLLGAPVPEMGEVRVPVTFQHQTQIMASLPKHHLTVIQGGCGVYLFFQVFVALQLLFWKLRSIDRQVSDQKPVPPFVENWRREWRCDELRPLSGKRHPQ